MPKASSAALEEGTLVVILLHECHLGFILLLRLSTRGALGVVELASSSGHGANAFLFLAFAEK